MRTKQPILTLLMILFSWSSNLFGQCWIDQNSGTTAYLSDVHFIDAQRGWAAGVNGTLLHTTNGGSTWNRQSTGTMASINGLYFLDANTGWAVTSQGDVLHTTNGGNSWTNQSSPTSEALEDLYFSDTSNGWAIGVCGTLLSTSNGGTNWTLHPDNGLVDANLTAIALSGQQGIITTSNTSILRTTDGGENWSLVNPGNTSGLFGVAMEGSTAIAVGATVWRSTDGGQNWSAVTNLNQPTTTWYSVAALGSGQWLVGGSSGATAYTSDDGNSWEDQPTGQTNTVTDLSAPGWAVGAGGKVWQYDCGEQTEPLQIFANETDVSCSGGQDGAIDLSVTGGTENYAFAWNYQNQTTEDLDQLPAGPYEVTVTDSGSGQQRTFSTTIEEPEAFNLETTQNEVTCPGGNDGQVSLQVGGGTAPYTYAWSNGSTTPTITDLLAGTYTVTVTDANGCDITDDVDINEPNSIEIIIQSTPATCPEAADGTLTLSVTGGSGDQYTYQWSDGNTQADRNNLSPGNYEVTVTDGNGCTATKAVTIDIESDDCDACGQVTIATPASTGNQFYCEGDPLPTLSVNVNVGETANWYTSETAATPIHTGNNFQPTNPGTYYAEAVLTNNPTCTSNTRTPVTLSQRATPTIGLNRQPDCLETGYIASLTILDADSVWTNADSLVQNENVYSLLYFSQQKSVVVRAYNGDCVKNFSQPAPNCDCALSDIAPPVAVVGEADYCPVEIDNIPELIAEVPDGLTVRWYNTSVGGEALAGNTLRFQPPSQGIYYAETYDPVERCRSNERTAFFVFQSDAPFIKEYDRFCNDDGTSYTVVLGIEGEDQLLNSAGNLERGLDNTYTITGIPINEEVRVIARNERTGCNAEFTTSKPECTCANITAPIAEEQLYVYCEGDELPVLRVGTPQEATANWFDAPDGGNLLAAETKTYRPDAPGIYYAETFLPAEDCGSNQRIGIKVERLEPSVTVFTETTCRISELEADTLTLTNAVGCDSLVITNRFLEPIPTITDTITVCDVAEVGVDSTVETALAGCSQLVVRYKALGDAGMMVAADAGSDQFFCEVVDAIQLNANLPDSANGLWLYDGPAMIDNELDPQTLVRGLNVGIHQFVWELRTEGCGEPALDTVIVNMAAPPQLVDDVYNIEANEGIEAGNIFDNDLFSEDYSFQYISQPSSGILLDEFTGDFSFSGSIAAGTYGFEYEICDVGCPTVVCDTAQLSINVECQFQVDADIPDGFNPLRGDVFDPLGFVANINCGVMITEADLHVRDRWGKNVYRTSADDYIPWDGKGKRNRYWPTDTYFYTLQLSFDNGEKRVVNGRVLLYLRE